MNGLLTDERTGACVGVGGDGSGGGGRKRKKNQAGILTFNWTDQMDFESLRKKKKSPG